MIKVIKASAGSGKTYQLTYEYIKLLLGVKRKGRYELVKPSDVERHRHILAVTFTNKATGEMKERIIKELSILAGEEPSKKSDYLDDLCRDFGNVQPEDVKKAAYRAMVEILFDYTNFNVSTIDAFFQLVLRTFAKELKMSYNYDVEIDDDYAIKVGVNDFFSSLAHTRSSSKEEVERAKRAKMWIREFVRDEVKGGKSWNIFVASEKKPSKKKNKSFSLGKFLDCLKQEDMRQYLDALVEYIDKKDESEEKPTFYIYKFKRALYDKMQDLKQAICDARKAILKLSEQDGLTADDLSGNGGMIWIQKIADNPANCDVSVLEYEKISKCISNGRENKIRWFKKKKEAGIEFVLSEQTIADICDQLEIMGDSLSSYEICRDMHRNIYMLGLLGEVKRYMERYRSENEMILLGDTNDLLRKIINNEETPFVYERVGVWLSHFLIDEFQDTSRSQWENMRPLLFNSCAEGSDNLIIGDEKQCIYRFRNADSSLLRTEVARHFTVTQNDGAVSYNWRSMPNVIEFNNMFFTSLAEKLEAQEEYSNVKQAIPEKKKHNNPGYVEINYVEKDAKDVESTSDDDAKGFKSKVLKQLPDLINSIVSRGYQYKDIAVLVFSNYDGVDVVQHIINYNSKLGEGEKKIDVVSNESLLLKNSASVRLIISHLRYLDSKLLLQKAEEGDDKKKDTPIDSEGYVHRLLRHYEHLMNTKKCEPGEALERSFEEVSKDVEDCELSLNSLLPENTESFNIVSITEHIIAQNVTDERLEHENAYIQAFQDCVLEFSNRSNASIHEFLKWWDKGGCNTSINSPDGQDAINVLTIHKSKGLEYKCVILPFCNWSLEGQEETLWVPKQEVLDSGLLSTFDEDIIPPVVPVNPKPKAGVKDSALGNYYGLKLQERRIDALNKTYVGFTRAVDEMYIFTPKEEYLKNANLESYLAEYREGEELIYTMGEKGQKVSDGKEAKEETVPVPKQEEANELNLPDKMPKYKVDNIKLQYKVVDMFTNDQRQQGIRLHEVMKRVRVLADLDYALFNYKVRAMLDEEIYEEDCRVLKKAVECPQVQWWFDTRNRVYNERSLLDDDGTITRPDRFFVTPDGRTVVVDYKFGKKTPENVEKYKKQVRGYIDVLKKTGIDTVEGYLWFPLEEDSDEAIVKV